MKDRSGTSGKRILAAAAVACGAIAYSQSASATVIGFETGEGYTTGNVVSQPSSGSSAWSGGTVGSVAADGVGQVLSITPTSSEGKISYHPTVSNLGLNAGQTLGNAVVRFSFDIRINDPDQVQETEISSAPTWMRVYISGKDSTATTDRFFELEVSSAGYFRYYKGSSGSLLKAQNAGGTDFKSPLGEFFTVSGEINYQDDTFTLFVNGVQQKSGTGALTINFNASTPLDDLYFIVTSKVNSGNATFSVDNIKLEVVPEIASISLLGFGATVLLKRQRP